MDGRAYYNFPLRSDLSAEELRAISHRLLDIQIGVMDQRDLLEVCM